jgi:hypothetical protein
VAEQALGRHAPQRDEQRQRIGYEHDHELELCHNKMRLGGGCE